MKKLILSALTLSLLLLISCNQKNKQEETVTSTSTNADAVTVKIDPNIFSIKEIVEGYLSIKNALTKDDSNGTAAAGNALFKSLGNIDMKNLPQHQMKTFMDIAAAAKEQAKNIGENAGNIASQRNHFVLLSKAFNDLLQTFDTEQKLYRDYCPMADQGKGAVWISEAKDIKNPYFGSEMLSCGSIQKEF